MSEWKNECVREVVSERGSECVQERKRAIGKKLSESEWKSQWEIDNEWVNECVSESVSEW